MPSSQGTNLPTPTFAPIEENSPNPLATVITSIALVIATIVGLTVYFTKFRKGKTKSYQ
jgi:hypothetical protein